MSRILSVFRNPQHKVLIPYITVGYPSLEATLRAVPLLTQNGADIIELGIPFSDPLADGATIQESSYKALQSGITPEICLQTALKLRQKSDVPLVFMTYFNPIINYGLEKFCRDCINSGIDGLIVPDLPPEESGDLECVSQESGLDLIFLISPNTTEERIRLVAEKSKGFIYLVSVTGVTGTRDSLPHGLEDFISRVRTITDKPLCVGFGISNREQAKQISQLADGIIMGSKLIQLMKNDGSLLSLESFVREIRDAMD